MFSSAEFLLLLGLLLLLDLNLLLLLALALLPLGFLLLLNLHPLGLFLLLLHSLLHLLRRLEIEVLLFELVDNLVHDLFVLVDLAAIVEVLHAGLDLLF